MKKLIEYMLIGILGTVLVVSGYKLYRIWDGYHTAEEEYEDLKQFISRPNEGETQGADGDGHIRNIDFESLKQINPDIVAWLTIEAAGIDYPVVQGENNEYYLHYTYSGKANIAGSIFLDCQNMPDFSDGKIILYGHNMRDGSMFAALKKLNVSQEPLAVLYTPEETFQYKLSEEAFVSTTDEIYQLKKSEENHADSESIVYEDRILVLSTCSKEASSRHIFIGKLSGV